MSEPSPPLGLVEVFVPDEPLFAIYGCGARDRTSALRAFAHTLASGRWWRETGPVTLITRTEPRATIGILGRFDELTLQRLGWIQDEVDTVLPHMKVLTYQDARTACAVLAERFRGRFARTELRSFRFRAIPRGGYVVLGLLAYALDLRAEQLAPSSFADQPVVLVDDCVLTGRRVGETLADLDAPQVIVASLYASPGVREAIVRREERVSDCLAAYDLSDLAPQRLADDYHAWRARWADRDGGGAYWHGLTEHVCFPWNEPDIAFWNPRNQRQELGWPLAPPRNRQPDGGCGDGTPGIHAMTGGAGAFRPGDRVYAAPVDEAFVVIDGDTEHAWSLDPVASDMWMALMGADSWERALTALERTYDVPRTMLERDLRRFVDTLRDRNLLLTDGGDRNRRR